MPRVRVHQHVNPLAPHFRREPLPVELESMFERPEMPLHLDIGCARGRFLLKMAEVERDWNFLGVEIREPLVDEANRIASEKGFGNLHYVFCNAMLWLGRLLELVPRGRLQMVTIQFPDPWFKKKHIKRRMVNSELIGTLAEKLFDGGRVFFQTDIEFLDDEVAVLFRESGKFGDAPCNSNPFKVNTEREKAVEEKNLIVFRRMFVRK